MFSLEELEKVKSNLDELEKKGVLKRPIILFGYSDNSIFLMAELHKRGYEITGFIDNNPVVCGKPASNDSTIEISLAEDFLENYNGKFVFLIVSRFFSEMKKQLEMHGYIENEHIYRLIQTEDIGLWQNININSYSERKRQVLRGREIFQKLTARYREYAIMINPAGSIGDVYLMGCYIKQFLEKTPNVVFIFGSNTMVKLAKDIGFGKVECFSAEDIKDILLYARLTGFDTQNIQLLHTGVLSYRIWSRLLTKLNYTWLSHYRELFGLPQDIKPIFPDISIECKAKVKSFFENNNLKKGKTVILAPYANTIKNLQEEFWVILASLLKNQGYSICTNVANKHEKVIEGTIPIMMELNEMRECLEYAGFFISMRSGLCDILGNSNCKKFIFYTNERFDFISVYDFYSLKKMGFSGEIYEYIIGESNQNEITNDIICKLK